MEINRQYCPNAACVDVGKISHGNVKVYSHKEHRYYCATCGQRFRPSRDTLFYKLRTPRQDFIDAVGMLAERCSLRAIARIKRAKLGTVLHWLEIAGTQAATVESQLIQNLPLTQVQIDELWTFVKKSHVTCRLTNRTKASATTGSGQPSHCQADYALPAISVRSEAKWLPSIASNKYGREVMVGRRSLPATSCLLTLRRWLPLTAQLNHNHENAGAGDHDSPRAASLIRNCAMLKLISNALMDELWKCVVASSLAPLWILSRSSNLMAVVHRSTRHMWNATT